MSIYDTCLLIQAVTGMIGAIAQLIAALRRPP